MVEKVRHPVWKFAYKCTDPHCDAKPYRYLDQAEECESWHRKFRKWSDDIDVVATRWAEDQSTE